uniref:Uncharacterized protein n=1 Tax=Strigamia maritima TaxID=126957 RepID=T1J9G4_STRMM
MKKGEQMARNRGACCELDAQLIGFKADVGSWENEQRKYEKARLNREFARLLPIVTKNIYLIRAITLNLKIFDGRKHIIFFVAFDLQNNEGIQLEIKSAIGINNICNNNHDMYEEILVKTEAVFEDSTYKSYDPYYSPPSFNAPVSTSSAYYILVVFHWYWKKVVFGVHKTDNDYIAGILNKSLLRLIVFEM